MDLKNVVVLAQEGTWLDITAPDGTVLFQFKMVNRDSDECSLSVAKNVEKNRSRKGKVNVKASEEENKNTVIACIKSWRDPDKAGIDPITKLPDLDNLQEVIYLDGKELVCNYVNKKMILDTYGFIYRQADAYIVDDTSFFKIQEPA